MTHTFVTLCYCHIQLENGIRQIERFASRCTLFRSEPPALSGADTVTIIAHVGDSIKFDNVDVIAGTPDPTVTWYKDGKEIPALAGDAIGSVTLTDAGTYTVVAENIAGIAVHTVIVEVVEGSLIIFSPSFASAENWNICLLITIASLQQVINCSYVIRSTAYSDGNYT